MFGVRQIKMLSANYILQRKVHEKKEFQKSNPYKLTPTTQRDGNGN